MNTRKNIVREDSTLLAYLVKTFPDLNRTRLKQSLKFRSVFVNGKFETRHDHMLKAGDEVNITVPSLSAKARTKLPFPVVHEDDDILIIDKPEGLLTMATDKEKEWTAYHALTDYVRASGKTGRERIFIVHRLDREASGLIIFAKNVKTKEALQKNWQEVEKKYYAVVEGLPNEKSGTLESYLAEDKFRRVYSTGRSYDTKYARTDYRVLKEGRGVSLLEVTLHTGRKNQIRVHLSDFGHPIIGDEKYGSHVDAARRMGLHAFRLTFLHPSTSKPLTFASELPAPLSRLFR